MGPFRWTAIVSASTPSAAALGSTLSARSEKGKPSLPERSGACLP
jgi:hypothetical protein